MIQFNKYIIYNKMYIIIPTKKNMLHRLLDPFIYFIKSKQQYLTTFLVYLLIIFQILILIEIALFLLRDSLL